MRALSCLPALICISWALPGEVPTQDRRPLDHADTEAWKSLGGTRISSRGCWVLYTLTPADGADGALHARGVRGEGAHLVERGTGGAFDHDERHLVCLVKPAREAVRAAK